MFLFNFDDLASLLTSFYFL